MRLVCFIALQLIWVFKNRGLGVVFFVNFSCTDIQKQGLETSMFYCTSADLGIHKQSLGLVCFIALQLIWVFINRGLGLACFVNFSCTDIYKQGLENGKEHKERNVVLQRT